MKIIERIWVTASCILDWLTLSTVERPGYEQHPLIGKYGFGHHKSLSQTPTATSAKAGPTFKPPTGRLGELPGSDFNCQYPNMVDYEACSTEDNRGCWLRNKVNFTEYNIYTDYETTTPIGIHRYYVINATDYSTLNADGIIDTHGKAFQLIHADGKIDEPMFPGPWLQACWGDTVHILIGNSLTDNGTSIHWHGVRQLNSMQMDGVNGVTQCPIPPNHVFEYVWEAKQYGSSWYHSHFSVQYADGLQGPITLHGPSSANYDVAEYPTIMTDWGHNSAFYALVANVTDTLGKPSILLNGTGDVREFGHTNTSIVRSKYQLSFDQPANGRPRRYLLRLINTSFTTMLTFTIDNHLLQIISADFVPIVPYYNRSVTVAIGQRYNIIVEADQYNNTETNFWMRTIPHTECGDCVGPLPKGDPLKSSYTQTGIVRYNLSNQEDPQSSAWPIVLQCKDEPYESLVPISPWCVGSVANGDQKGEELAVTTDNLESNYTIAAFSLKKDFPVADPPIAFQINYSYPIFLDMWKDGPFEPEAVVIPEDYTENDWVYFVLMNNGFPIQHPIHLHGHDFAMLYISPPNTPFNAATFSMSCTDNPLLKCNNPPRRDVVTLSSKGFVVIAFKTDNPGSWLMHCHIAFHASYGLALQVMERLPDANKLWPVNGAAWQNANNLCVDWRNYWGSKNEDDSGI